MPGRLDLTVHWLRRIAPGCALTSATLVAVAMATPGWLTTAEVFLNGTDDLLTKRTYSGLWSICFTPFGSDRYVCRRIDYFPRESYSPDPQDSTMSIPYAVVTAGPFLFACAAVLLSAEVCYAVGHLVRRRRLWSFVGGINFILAGLLAMVGIVVYISTFKAEVKNKLRSLNVWDPPRITYSFGYSFYILVAGFIMAELTGMIVIFLYILWHQRDWERKKHKLSQQQQQQLKSPGVCPGSCCAGGDLSRLSYPSDRHEPSARWKERGFHSLPRRLHPPANHQPAQNGHVTCGRSRSVELEELSPQPSSQRAPSRVFSASSEGQLSYVPPPPPATRLCSCHGYRPPCPRPYLRPPACVHVCRHHCHLPPTCAGCGSELWRGAQPRWPEADQGRCRLVRHYPPLGPQRM